MDALSASPTDDGQERTLSCARWRSCCQACGHLFDLLHEHGRRRLVCYRASCTRELKREQNRATDRRRRLRLYGTPAGRDACPRCFYERWRCRCAKDGLRT